MNSQTQSHIDPDPSSDQAIKGWIGSLGSHDPNVRKTAYGRLTGIGKPAMPALIQLTADPEPELRREAAAILGDIGDPTSIPTLIDLLVDEAFEVRWRAGREPGQNEARRVSSRCFKRCAIVTVSTQSGSWKALIIFFGNSMRKVIWAPRRNKFSRRLTNRCANLPFRRRPSGHWKRSTTSRSISQRRARSRQAKAN